ncbi:hypothetical protein EDI_047390 [Entamoeba dispar SAW760]|uniref:Set2 Rpb1 interacting domain-containing protein n=1 Tax=Entamoeba dispar (strain ATCC PRA-260 / SAW760) TaxID=370354 RepID=B0EGE5_ENTDS|nr:uncharacterized protein EDI_047390 [Entamoeba dispar SAW760]EDR26399.1 hypothetical protein EDI_047390 [Entamoeba dispar SAW760]|eukprot:EDR26399.1 hypothetical protein EDI_047390 [Entamoeba dispar SAW760]
MSSDTETEVVENISDSVTEEEKPEHIEEPVTKRTTRRQANHENQRQEFEVEIKKENKERKPKKKTTRKNLVSVESEEEEEISKPSPRKPRQTKDKSKITHQKKINEKKEIDESEDVVDIKKLSKRLKEEPNNNKPLPPPPVISESIVQSINEQPIIKQEVTEITTHSLPQPYQSSLSIPSQNTLSSTIMNLTNSKQSTSVSQQNYIQNTQNNPQNNYMTNQPFDGNTSYIQPINQTLQPITNNGMVLNQPIQIQQHQSVIIPENSNIELKRSQEHQSSGVSYKFERLYGYAEGDTAYDPLIGLYANRKKEQRIREQHPPPEYITLKSVVSKFVVNCLQPFYDNGKIQDRDRFKSIAKNFTTQFTNELYETNQPLSLKAQRYFNSVICDKFEPHYY